MPPQANTRTTAGVGAGTADADGDDNEQNDEENEQWEEEEEEEEGAPALADSCIDDDDEDDGFAVSAPNSGGGGVGAGSGAQATAMISLSSSASPQMWPVMSNTRSFLSAEHVTIRSGPAEQSPVTAPLWERMMRTHSPLSASQTRRVRSSLAVRMRPSGPGMAKVMPSVWPLNLWRQRPVLRSQSCIGKKVGRHRLVGWLSAWKGRRVGGWVGGCHRRSLRTRGR